MQLHCAIRDSPSRVGINSDLQIGLRVRVQISNFETAPFSELLCVSLLLTSRETRTILVCNNRI